MISRYIKRILAWGVLIAALTIGTIFIRGIVIDPLEQDIIDLEKKQADITRQISFISSQINLYNDVYFDANEIDQLVPTGFNQLEIENQYIKKPVIVESVNGTLKGFTITNNSKPEHLKLSNNISGVKVSATVQFQTEQQLINYIEELHNTVRSIYISSLNYNLPGETSTISTFTYTIQIEYYLFYYTAK